MYNVEWEIIILFITILLVCLWELFSSLIAIAIMNVFLGQEIMALIEMLRFVIRPFRNERVPCRCNFKHIYT